MIRHFLMAGLVPASFCMANPIAYSEGGCNVAAMGTYARYGIEQHFNGFALDTALNFNLSLVDVQSVSFSTGIYKNFGSWRLGPEFTTGLAAVGWEKPFVYTSYAVRAWSTSLIPGRLPNQSDSSPYRVTSDKVTISTPGQS